MMICKDYYVCNKLGEIFKVTQIRKGSVRAMSLNTGIYNDLKLTSIKPFCVQNGDKVSIIYHDGLASIFTLVNIIYIRDRDTYLYKFKNPEGSNETFSSEEFEVIIDTFTE